MKKKYKILNTIGEVFTPEAKEVLKTLGDVSYFTPSQDELLGLLADTDVAIVGLGLVFDKSLLEKASQLKVIATATTGLDHIDIEAAKTRGVEVLSLRGEEAFLKTITGTAELAWGLLLDLVRFTPWAFESVKQYAWDREAFRGHSLYGKTLGIVGFGRLGQWMERYGAAFGMKVIFYDPYVSGVQTGSSFGRPTSKFLVWTSDAQIKKVTFNELLEMSDVVSIHAHLSKETEGIFNAEAFRQMKKNAYLINTSRGAIVHEGELLEALKEGTIAGYATDVLKGEPWLEKEFSKHPLVEYAKTHHNLIIVPHIGGMTQESREQTDIFIAQKLARYLSQVTQDDT